MSKVNIKPLADRVLVQPEAAEETTASGIIIPDTAKEKPQRGTVIAIGNGKKDAHPQKESEGEVFHEGRPDEQAGETFHHSASVRWTCRIRCSGFSTCSVFQVRRAQTSRPMITKAPGARSKNPFGRYQPPSPASGRMV